MRKFQWLTLLLCMVFLFCSCSAGTEGERSPSDGTAKVLLDLIPTNGGDALLLRTAEQVILIDTGYAETTDDVIDYLHSTDVSEIDVLLITHFDKDHIGGVPGLLEAFSVKRIYQPVYEKTETKAYTSYLTSLSQTDVLVTDVTEPLQWTADECVFDVFPAQGSDYSEEDNDYSLVTRMQCGDVAFLFAGDAEADRINEMLQSGTDWSADVLKYPHHGSYNKNSVKLIKAVDPAFVLIPDGGEKQASEKLLSYLAQRNCTVLKTSNGAVRLQCDGKTVQVLA